MDIQAATLLELQDEFQRLALVISSAVQERSQIWDEIQSRQKSIAAKIRLNTLTKAEKDALREELRRSP